MQTQSRAAVQVPHTANAGSRALTVRQIVTVAIIGIVLWFAAAMTVQFGSTRGLFGPVASAVLFAVSIPGVWLAVWASKTVARLGPGQTLPGVVIGTIVATFADGIALTWARGLYGIDSTMTTLGAAWILWGVGLFLLFAYLDDAQQARATY
jgi:hypothetical protein